MHSNGNEEVAKKHELPAPLADSEAGKQIPAEPKADTTEDPAAGHGDHSDGEPAAESQTTPAAELPAEVVDHSGQADGATESDTAEAARVAKPTRIESVTLPAPADTPEDDPIKDYHWVLKELPGMLDRLVERIDVITGRAMDSETAMKTLNSMEASIRKLREAEEGFAEVPA